MDLDCFFKYSLSLDAIEKLTSRYRKRIHDYSWNWPWPPNWQGSSRNIVKGAAYHYTKGGNVSKMWIRSNKGGVRLTTAMIIQRTNYNLVSSRSKNTCEHIDQEATAKVWSLPVGITRSWSALVHMVSGFVKMWPKMFANPSSYLILQDVKSNLHVNIHACMRVSFQFIPYSSWNGIINSSNKVAILFNSPCLNRFGCKHWNLSRL